MNNIDVCEKNVPVYVGSDKPMVKKREHADWFHGPDGMGNMNYPDPEYWQEFVTNVTLSRNDTTNI